MADTKKPQTPQALSRSQQTPEAIVSPQVIRSPFSLMRRMMEDMDRMFDDFATRQTFDSPLTSLGWMPEVEVFRREGKLVVRADLPGMSQDDVKVYVDDDGSLVIEGERKDEREKREGDVYHSERAYGSFERRLALPRGVDPSTSEASFVNGVLEVTMPLPKEERKSIAVKSATTSTQAQQPPRSGNITQNGPGVPTPARH